MIQAGVVSFPGEDSVCITADAKNFILSLLVLDPSQRVTTCAALQHSWLQIQGDTAEPKIDLDVLWRCRRFAAANPMKRVVLRMLVNSGCAGSIVDTPERAA